MSGVEREAGAGAVATPLRMSAYYYGFDETGARSVDMILSAVACAGKAFHNTESWNDPDEWQPHAGATPVEWIQNAANEAAAIQADLLAALQLLVSHAPYWISKAGEQQIDRDALAAARAAIARATGERK